MKSRLKNLGWFCCDQRSGCPTGSTDDHPHFERLVKAWREGMVGGGEPVVWAGCLETLRHPEILAHPLFKEMVITLCGIADVYACRLQQEFPSAK
jgi:hypothetical protein